MNWRRRWGGSGLTLLALLHCVYRAHANPPLACQDTFPMPAASARADMKCRLVVVRHIVKCAGTTMRGVWERLSLATLDWHTQSVFPAPMHHCFYGAMKRRREAITKYTQCAVGELKKRVQSTIEYHVSTDGSTSLASDLRLLRSVPRMPSHHRAVLIGLVREPKSWFASVYRYQLVYRFKRVDMKEYIARAQSPQLGHLLGGSGFVTNISEAWRRHPAGLPEMHPYEGRFVRAEYPSAEKVLAAFDVFGTMAQFSHALFLTCHHVGLPVCPHFARTWESQPSSARPGARMAPAKKDVPPGPWPFYSDTDVAQIHGLIDRFAHGDRWLYQFAAARLERDIETLEPSVLGSLKAYVAAQEALTRAKVLSGEQPCRPLRAWNVTERRGCRMSLTEEGEAAVRETGIPPGQTVWDAE